MSKTIDDILKDLPLDAPAAKSLTELWNAELADAKIAQETKIREEQFSQYNTDLDKIQEALGIFLEDRIKPHVAELREGVKSVEDMKRKYAKKITNVTETAQKHVKRRLAAVEQVVEARVKSELTELHADVVANRRAALTAVTEAKVKLDSDRQVFKAKAAKVLEDIINIRVPKQLEPLTEDIKAARQDNFGREMFEAFQTSFRRQFFNTSSEFNKLVEENRSLKKATAVTKRKAAKAIKESRESAVSAKMAYGKLNEAVTRNKNMVRLLKPLSGTTRAQMKALLESTKIENMDATFRKELPHLVRSGQSQKSKTARLAESRRVRKPTEFRSGGSEARPATNDDGFDAELVNIQRLAGNTK